MKSRFLLALGVAFGGGLSLPAAETSAATAAAPAIDHMVYLSFLPDAGELMADAKANGLTILRLDQTAGRVVVTYKYPDGHIATLGYARLDAAGRADRVAVRPVEVERHSTVVVREAPEVVCVERAVYRDPRDDYWAPLTVGFGVGWVSGHHGHDYYRHSGRGSHRDRSYSGGYDRGHGRGWRR